MFHVPGHVEGATRTFYKRARILTTPRVRAFSDLEAQGWSPVIPYGTEPPYKIDVTENPEGISVSFAFRIYFLRADLDAALRSIAQRYQAWWDGLTADEQAVDDRVTTNAHFRSSIGRAWADRPYNNIIAIHRGSFQTTVNSRDAEDWYLGNLEQWAYERGFDAFVTALAVGSRRTVLNAQLDAHTICHLDADADIGERLINPGDGFTDDEWAAFSGAHFNDAAGTEISIATEADKTVESNAQTVIVSTPR